jgi:hypothetical protein
VPWNSRDLFDRKHARRWHTSPFPDGVVADLTGISDGTDEFFLCDEQHNGIALR